MKCWRVDGVLGVAQGFFACQGRTDQCIPYPWNQGLQPKPKTMQPSVFGAVGCWIQERGELHEDSSHVHVHRSHISPVRNRILTSLAVAMQSQRGGMEGQPQRHNERQQKALTHCLRWRCVLVNIWLATHETKPTPTQPNRTVNLPLTTYCQLQHHRVLSTALLLSIARTDQHLWFPRKGAFRSPARASNPRLELFPSPSWRRFSIRSQPHLVPFTPSHQDY